MISSVHKALLFSPAGFAVSNLALAHRSISSVAYLQMTSRTSATFNWIRGQAARCFSGEIYILYEMAETREQRRPIWLFFYSSVWPSVPDSNIESPGAGCWRAVEPFQGSKYSLSNPGQWKEGGAMAQ